jgi:hypothetical protein
MQSLPGKTSSGDGIKPIPQFVLLANLAQLASNDALESAYEWLCRRSIAQSVF